VDPDVEKAKAKAKGGKKRRRSLRAYVNMNQPVNPEAAAMIDQFPPDPDDQVAAEKAAGNPVDHPDGGSWTDRLSPSRATGQGSPSTGDHNASAWQDPMNVPGPRAQFMQHPLARGHADLQQSTTAPFPLSMMRTYNGDNQFGDRDFTLGGGRVSLQRLDAAGATGLSSPPGNPVSRPMPHIAPIGANNGTHGLAQPEARHPASMKNSERVDAMKRMLFPGSGGGR
jgi:hypothetical protein